jgi:hypothetical protein
MRGCVVQICVLPNEVSGSQVQSSIESIAPDAGAIDRNET